MAAAVTAIAAGTNNHQLKAGAEKMTVVAVVAAIAAAKAMVIATAARTATMVT
jgi:hypothetical protein